MMRRQGLRRRGGWLALAALALQLVLSFGHIHASEVTTLLGPMPGHGNASAVVFADRQHGAPGSQDPADDVAEGACAICASMALAGNLLLPEPVKLPLPSGAPVEAAWSGERHVASAQPFRLFQSRAPPTV
jgi:hypothetical protein